VIRRYVPLLLALAAVACEEDANGPGPQGPTYNTLQVDARTTWVYANLATNQVVAVTDPLTSTNWDIGFFATRVVTNGGAAGAGDVEGHCICQNAGATDPQILAMTAAGEEADFTAVTAAAIPSTAAAWASDALDPAIENWWSYNPTSHAVSANPTAVYAMKLRGTAFAKMHVTNLQNAAMAHAGDVTIEFAVQPAAADPFGSVTTLTVNLASGPVYVDLIDGVLGSSSDWDIQLTGYTILVNGGISGTGGVAALETAEDFATLATVSDVPAAAYATGVDGYAGVFAAEPWYRYNLDGNNLISPTFNVYLIRRGTQVWKVQITSYYSTAGTGRFITFRSELL
jgi:hypothetical protein